MSLDFSLVQTLPTEVYSANITHNLGRMAQEAGLYKALWHPEELPEVKVAADLVPILEEGLARLRSEPDHYRSFDASNGWGTYKDFVRFVEEALKACREFPDATIETCT